MTNSGHAAVDSADLTAGGTAGEHASPSRPGHDEGLTRHSRPQAAVRLVSPRPDADRRTGRDADHLGDGQLRRVLLAPVRSGCDGAARLVIVRQPDGTRVGLAFTTPAALCAVLGEEQPHLRLSEQALRAMLVDIGVVRVHVDPSGLARTEPSVATAGRTTAATAH